MEIATLSPGSIRIKGKQAACVVNPNDKNASYAFAVLFNNPKRTSLKIHADAVTVEGPGEYEIGGIKVSGTYYDTEVGYSFLVDDVSILLVSTKTLVKYHQKLREHDIVIIIPTTDDDPSVAVNIADSIVMYSGERAKEIVKRFVTEGVAEMNKYVVTKDKLPDEVVQILLV